MSVQGIVFGQNVDNIVGVVIRAMGFDVFGIYECWGMSSWGCVGVGTSVGV
jgi:hypothetical protein